MKPALYVFEGPDGVGKTTLASRLEVYLDEKGIVSEVLAFPGRKAGTVGEHIYRLYHQPEFFGINHIPVTTEQILFVAAHAEVIQSQALPALLAGKIVLLDRYWWSTWVYSTASGLDLRIRDLLVKLELEIWQGVSPRCIFLLNRDRDPDSEHDHEKWCRLVSLYETLRSQQAAQLRIVAVDNNGAFETAVAHVANEIMGDLAGDADGSSQDVR